MNSNNTKDRLGGLLYYYVKIVNNISGDFFEKKD